MNDMQHAAMKGLNAVGYMTAGFDYEVPPGHTCELRDGTIVTVLERATDEEVNAFCVACGLPRMDWPYHYKVVTD